MSSKRETDTGRYATEPKGSQAGGFPGDAAGAKPQLQGLDLGRQGRHPAANFRRSALGVNAGRQRPNANSTDKGAGPAVPTPPKG